MGITEVHVPGICITLLLSHPTSFSSFCITLLLSLPFVSPFFFLFLFATKKCSCASLVAGKITKKLKNLLVDFYRHIETLDNFNGTKLTGTDRNWHKKSKASVYPSYFKCWGELSIFLKIKSINTSSFQSQTGH